MLATGSVSIQIRCLSFLNTEIVTGLVIVSILLVQCSTHFHSSFLNSFNSYNISYYTTQPPIIIVQYFGDIHYSSCPLHPQLSAQQSAYILNTNESNTSYSVLIADSLCIEALNRSSLVQSGNLRLIKASSFRNQSRIQFKNSTHSYRQRQDTLCIERWRIFYEYFKSTQSLNINRNRKSRILIADSDTLLFYNPNLILSKVAAECELALVLYDPPQIPVVPAFVLISIDALYDFIRFSEALLPHLSKTPNDMKLWAWYIYWNDTDQHTQPKVSKEFLKKLSISRAKHILHTHSIFPPKFTACSLETLQGNIKSPQLPLQNQLQMVVFDDNLKFTRGKYVSNKESDFVRRISWSVDEAMPYFSVITEFGIEKIRCAGMHFQGKKKHAMLKYLKSSRNSFLNAHNPVLIRNKTTFSVSKDEFCDCLSLQCENCLGFQSNTQ
mmetsp:Transcript_11905/g.21543  ORF Transcript_11905/g.21543 Transcript_11905/m.21543 type:complete len:440 (+) Transcript_11905:59-1378(+)